MTLEVFTSNTSFEILISIFSKAFLKNKYFSVFVCVCVCVCVCVLDKVRDTEIKVEN